MPTVLAVRMVHLKVTCNNLQPRSFSFFASISFCYALWPSDDSMLDSLAHGLLHTRNRQGVLRVTFR